MNQTLLPKVSLQHYLIRWLKNLATFDFFLVPICQPIILIYRRGNFVYHHLGCTSIYRPLSYPTRSLTNISLHVVYMVAHNQEGRGHRAVYFASPQSLIITFSLSLAEQPWGLLLNFDWFISFS